jgi:hypothetical protein
MRTLIAALTCLMLFTTPVMAGDLEDGVAAYQAGDFRKAFRIFKPFAKQGDARAQTAVGFMYERGNGVSRDDKKAFHWYRKAAEQGHAQAQHKLGFMYERGNGVSLDNKKAFHWYRKAAEQGFAQAQLALAVMYAFGRGISMDQSEGYAWLMIARALGDDEPKRSIDAITRLYSNFFMSPDRLKKGRQLAKRYCAEEIVPSCSAVLDQHIKQVDEPPRVVKEESQPETSDEQSGSDRSVADRLRDLKDLYTEGLISEDEFNSKKQEILDAL